MVRAEENARFQPSPEQLEFAKTYLDYDKRKTLEEIAKDIGIAYTTIWRWFQKDDFVDWINSKKDELINKGLMGIYKTAMRKAHAGDFQFAKLLLEIKGEYVQKSESKITQVKDDIENLTMEELIKEFEHDLDIYRARTDKSKDNGSKSKRAKKG